ncbi:MAG TPA: hypothetical protein VFM27_02800 [Acidimicrobiales bacterium]|nr:hypothetical protein [Acidimicrobiales bacterium]
MPNDAQRRISEERVVWLTTSALPGYLDRYEASITGPLGMTVDEIDRTYDTEIRIRPTRVRLTDTSA